MKAFAEVAAVLGLVALIGLPAAAQEPRYKAWEGQTQTGDMPELLKKLRTLADQAERSRAADPAFINDLRSLANTYDNPWPIKILSDDFRDGDFTRGPGWTVLAGTWQVDTRGRFTGLHSTIAKPQAATAQQPGAGGGGNAELIGNVLGTLLKQQQQQQQAAQPAQPAADEHATIFAPANITNAFAMRLELASRDGGGRFDFGPSIGQRGDNLYRITYMPDAESGFVLSRVTSQGTQQLASSNGRISLEDGKSHTIDWKRDQAGKMTVALDGAQVIEAHDTQIKRPFDGLLMANNGGAYWIRAVEITGAK
jgi:hypothetical protein